MERAERVVIVAEPGRLRDALKALFEATPELGISVDICGKDVLGEDCPLQATVVVLAGGLFGKELPRAVATIREKWPGAKILVLAEDAAQWRQAKASGADRVHFAGIVPEKLVRAVRRLLQEGQGGGNAVELLPGTEAGGVSHEGSAG
jgi:DNA-binding NarL/FixJ family response regulator